MSVKIGDPFERLTVISFSHRDSRRHAHWNCLCKCGTVCVVDQCSLVKGVSRSCGCLQRELLAERNRTHGLADTPEYQALRDAVARTTNPEHKSFKYYGARGITVWPDWRQNPQAFIDYIGLRTSPNHTLERINNDGNYEPGNVRWATRSEQNRNRRVLKTSTPAFATC
jgi:hypothetical protein